MSTARPRNRAWLGLMALLAVSFAQADDLSAEAVEGDGEVLLKIVNVSHEALLLWLPACGLAVQTRLDDDAAPFTRACGFGLTSRPHRLVPGDFLLEHRPFAFPKRPALLTQTVSLTYSLDPRSDAERERHGQPLPMPPCLGIPCPLPRRAGLQPDDPLNPMNFPRRSVTLITPPLSVGQP